MRIGFIGLGHMGLPMALRLVQAGHIVTGFDQALQCLLAFKQQGGNAADSIEAATVRQDVIITMLQTGEQVSEVTLGKRGVFSCMQTQSLYIDCSTIDVATAKNIHSEASKLGFSMLDAPVSGGVVGAQSGTLTFMVGGKKELFQRSEPILNIMGKQIIHAGEAGLGQAAKICNNMVLGINMIAVSEAFVLAQKLGLNQQTFFDIIQHASGRSWVTEHYLPVPGILENVPANHDYVAGFAAAMMQKDLQLSQLASEDVKLNTPMAAMANHLYQSFNADGKGHLDFSAIIQLYCAAIT